MVIGDSSYISAVHWVGPEDLSIHLPQLAHKEVLFYKKCIFGPMTIEIGNFVLISNADAAEPDTIAGCDIAKILYLYELQEDSNTDPFRAIVQWYSRPEKIPHKLFDSDQISIDFNTEIIEDYRPFDRDVSIETIFQKCVVITAKSSDSSSFLLTNKTSLYSMFVCRYKLVKIKNTYKLIPLESDENVEELRRTERLRTPKKSIPKKDTKSSQKKNRSEFATTPKSNRSHKRVIQELEFVDVNNCIDETEKKNFVSPIKIVRNTVVKLSKNNSTNLCTPSIKKTMELNGNYLTESPEIDKHYRSNFSNSKLNIARRNLNVSLENETIDSDNMLNYSIIRDTSEKSGTNNEMKIKLRLSEKQSKKNVDYNETTENINEEKSTKDSIEGKPKRSTRSLSRKRSIYEEISSEDNNIEGNSDSLKRTRIRSLKYLDTPTTHVSTTRRKSILKTPGDKNSNTVDTPKRNIQLSNLVEEMIFTKNSIISTPTSRTPSKKKLQTNLDQEYLQKTPKRQRSMSQCKTSEMTPTQKMKLIRSGTLTPTINNREKISSNYGKSELQLIRERLHVSAIPESLPCREIEFQNIYTFLEGKIEDQCGGCMYVSGVPGTGKTATVTGVINSLKHAAEMQEIPHFEFIGINGMRLTEPRQAYVHIYKQLTGKTVSWQHAHDLLEKRFTIPSPRRMITILLVDELDILCNRRQDVVYNLLDWPSKSVARLVVVTIANTMDLPERLLMGKVTSRLGLTRLTFQPYSHKQLQEIVMARLGGSDTFKSDAVQLVARKVASVSGDARRALDICRRATEIAETKTNDNGNKNMVNMSHVQQALSEMITSAKVQAIKNCSKLEQIFLQAVSAEVSRTGVEETNFLGVYSQIEAITAFMGIPTPVPGRALKICANLGSERLLICEHSRNDIFQKIILNVSMDDIHYALQIKIN